MKTIVWTQYFHCVFSEMKKRIRVEDLLPVSISFRFRFQFQVNTFVEEMVVKNYR